MWEKFKFSKILFLLWHTKIPIEHKKEKKKKKKEEEYWQLKARICVKTQELFRPQNKKITARLILL